MLHDTANLVDPRYIEAASAIIGNFQKLFDTQFSSGQEKLIIAISGDSGSGKTSLAYQLSKQLINRYRTKARYINVKHLNTDNFYIENYQQKPPAERESRIQQNDYQGIGPDEYDWSMIAKILHCFRQGYSCRMPCIDVLNQQIDYLETNFSGVDVVIMDGLYAIDARMEANINIFIDQAYYQREDWARIREDQTHNLADMGGLKQYSESILEASNKPDFQDVRGKERLSQARIIRLEKEHQALNQIVDSASTRENFFRVRNDIISRSR